MIEIRIITLVLVVAAVIFIWMTERGRCERLIPATVYFSLIILFNSLTLLRDNFQWITPNILNAISAIIRIVSIITVMAYLVIERRD